MPFQIGNQYAQTRKVHSGGRPPNDSHQQLQADLSEAWPQEQRIELLKTLTTRAHSGDNIAIRILLAYTYGRPGSADEQRIQEQLDKEVETIIQTLEENLSPPAWNEVKSVLRLG